MYDEGYCCTEDMYCEGGQFVIQPDFAKADQQFRRKERLPSAATVTDRSLIDQETKVVLD